MKLRVNGITIDKWCNLSLMLIYDSIKSTFSFDLYWEPQNPDKFWRNLLLPGAYNVCTIVADNGEVMLTGVMHSPSFKSGAQKYLVNISGCSITGVLDDIEYSAIVKDTQSTGLSIFQIACKCANELGIFVISNTNKSGQINSQNTPDIDQACSSYLADICKDVNIIATHDQYGNLVLDVPTNDKIAFNFSDGQPGITIDLAFDGEKMHSVLIGKSAPEVKDDSPQAVYAYNPYVPSQGAFNYRNAARNNNTIFNAPSSQGMQLQLVNEFNAANRPGIFIQSDTDATNLQDFIDQKLAEELSNIKVTVNINTWLLGDTVIRPGMNITILSPENYLFQKTKFFVESVVFEGDEKMSIATLNCVVPEVYNGQKPKNIFIANNQYLKWNAASDVTAPLKQQPNL